MPRSALSFAFFASSQAKYFTAISVAQRVPVRHTLASAPVCPAVCFCGMLQAGLITTDYASLMVEILKDNSRPDAGAIYGAIDMPWAKLVGQIARAYGK
jgi:hypothetical protein